MFKMSKKIILLINCIGFILLTTACQNDNVNEEYVPEPPITNETPAEIEFFEFSITIIENEELAELSGHQTVNHGSDGGLDLIFNFNKPVTNFAIINVLFTNSAGDNEYGFVKTGEVIAVGNVEDILILTNYWTLGTHPHLGLTFTTPDGEEVWYIFSRSMMDGTIHWRQFHWSRNYDLYNN